MDRIRSIRTPTPPKAAQLNFDASMEFLDKRHVTESLADINADEFRPKTFSSSSSNVKVGKSDGADILKVKGETRPIKVDSNDDDPLFHQNVNLNTIHLHKVSLKGDGLIKNLNFL